MTFKFKWPYKDRVTKDSTIKANGQPVARILDIEETEEGIYVTGEWFDPESGIAKKIMGFDPAGYSLGPLSTAPKTLPAYSKWMN